MVIQVKVVKLDIVVVPFGRRDFNGRLENHYLGGEWEIIAENGDKFEFDGESKNLITLNGKQVEIKQYVFHIPEVGLGAQLASILSAGSERVQTVVHPDGWSASLTMHDHVVVHGGLPRYSPGQPGTKRHK